MSLTLSAGVTGCGLWADCGPQMYIIVGSHLILRCHWLWAVCGLWVCLVWVHTVSSGVMKYVLWADCWLWAIGVGSHLILRRDGLWAECGLWVLNGLGRGGYEGPLEHLAPLAAAEGGRRGGGGASRAAAAAPWRLVAYLTQGVTKGGTSDRRLLL